MVDPLLVAALQLLTKVRCREGLMLNTLFLTAAARLAIVGVMVLVYGAVRLMQATE